MPLLEDLLLRFRRIWSPPGPVAGQPGVPEEAGARLDDEVRELSGELGSIDEEAAGIERDAAHQAAGIVDAAAAEAERTVADARARLPSLRAERAALRIRDRQADVERVVAEAGKEGAALLVRARSRTPELVKALVEEVFAEAETPEEGHARVLGGG